MCKIANELAKMIIEAAEDAGYETRSYSGRSMYGRECLGISFDRDGSGSDIVIDIIQSSNRRDLVDIMEALKGAREDSMGMGGIIYWPHIPYVDSEDSEDVESED